MLNSARMPRLRLGATLALLALISSSARASSETLTKIDNDLLDDIARRSFRYFWENTNPQTGLALDRARTNGEPDDKRISKGVASIAATGFGLTSFCIAADHRWISRETARRRVITTLHFFAYDAPQEHGWFYHFMDASTGERLWNSEVSSIDTALLLAGVLTSRQFFQDDPQVTALANLVYQRVDFPWMMDGSSTYFSHGWKPEGGFLHYRWDTYSELMILYVLGIGSPTHSISSASWNAWKLPMVAEGGYSFIGGGPLFIHQYSQAWIDLRDRGWSHPAEGSQWRGVDYFANSVAATRAQREIFSKNLSREFPGYSSNVWGVTASDSVNGYTAWGNSAKDPRIDGTVVPSAAAGSLMFTPDICVPAMRAMLVRYGKTIYGRYGFADAFNPNTGWVSRYVIGIDAGIALLSAENLRNGRVWQWFMSNAEPAHALDLAGLVKIPEQTVGQGIPPAGQSFQTSVTPALR
jgi:hypothetical protein